MPISAERRTLPLTTIDPDDVHDVEALDRRELAPLRPGEDPRDHLDAGHQVLGPGGDAPEAVDQGPLFRTPRVQ
jgi:hypothetical protein